MKITKLNGVDELPLRKMYSAEFDLADRLVDLFATIFDNKLENRQVRPDEEHIIPLIQFCARSLKTSRAILTLAEQGYGEDAGVLARSLMESVINFIYMAQAPRINGLLYKRHAYVTELDGYERFKGRSDSPIFRDEIAPIEKECQSQIKAIEKSIMELRPLYDFVEQRKNDWRGWSGKSMSYMLKVLGNEAEMQYDTTFWILSRYTHPNAMWMKSLRQESEKGILIDARPSNSYVRAIILSALCYYLITICYAVNDFFNLGKESKVVEFEKEFREISKKKAENG